MRYELMEVLEEAHLNGLDPIKVFWINYGSQRGEMVVTCYDSAWKAYFGGMHSETIQQFVDTCGADYLLPKLGITQWSKQTKRYDAYLTRIIKAIKSKLREELARAVQS